MQMVNALGISLVPAPASVGKNEEIPVTWGREWRWRGGVLTHEFFAFLVIPTFLRERPRKLGIV